jgi:hypothetical protein
MPAPLIPAYEHPQFQPAMRIVTAITNGLPCLITTSFPHNYLTGLVVRLDIPESYGMVQANQLFGPIFVVDATHFSMPINTTFFNPFVVPLPAVISTLAQVVPMAEIASQIYQAQRDVAPYIFLP